MVTLWQLHNLTTINSCFQAIIRLLVPNSTLVTVTDPSWDCHWHYATVTEIMPSNMHLGCLFGLLPVDDERFLDNGLAIGYHHEL